MDIDVGNGERETANTSVDDENTEAGVMRQRRRHRRIISTVPEKVTVKMFLTIRRLKQRSPEDNADQGLDIINDFLVRELGFVRDTLDRTLTNETLKGALVTEKLILRMHEVFVKVTTGQFRQ